MYMFGHLLTSYFFRIKKIIRHMLLSQRTTHLFLSRLLLQMKVEEHMRHKHNGRRNVTTKYSAVPSMEVQQQPSDVAAPTSPASPPEILDAPAVSAFPLEEISNAPVSSAGLALPVRGLPCPLLLVVCFHLLLSFPTLVFLRTTSLHPLSLFPSRFPYVVFPYAVFRTDRTDLVVIVICMYIV